MTTLFGFALIVSTAGESVRVTLADSGRAAHSAQKYGFVWACLGDPMREIYDFPESHEPDRYVASVGSFAVRCSGLRAVENFLDFAHLPFVHAGSLGAEPYTEVPPYNVTLINDEVWATGCYSHQPLASAHAETALDVDYTYRVLRPFTVALYKTNEREPNRRDALAMMVQPVTEETSVLHLLCIYLIKGDPDRSARWFTRAITAQDKPILENQRPVKLPLDPRAELPVRADASGTAYRAWLRKHGIRYGAIW